MNKKNNKYLGLNVQIFNYQSYLNSEHLINGIPYQLVSGIRNVNQAPLKHCPKKIIILCAYTIL